MLRKLVSLTQSDALGLFVATAAIGYGIGKIQRFVKDRQEYLTVLNQEVADRERELVAMTAPLSPAPVGYPSRDDLDPLNNGIED